MGIHRVRSVLLRRVDFLPVYEVVSMSLWHHILWKDSVVASLAILIIVLVETHCHWWSHVLWTTHASHTTDIVLVVVHFEYLLLLGSQVLVNLRSISIWTVLSTIHHSKAHSAWYKNIVLSILTSTWSLDLWWIHEVVVVLDMVRILSLRTIHSLQLLMVSWSSVFIGVVSHISSIWNNILVWSKCTFLVVTV